jgi:hypothetical protein
MKLQIFSEMDEKNEKILIELAHFQPHISISNPELGTRHSTLQMSDRESSGGTRSSSEGSSAISSNLEA